jgi:hypothetical protein
LHTIFSFYKELEGRWNKAVKAVWKKVQGDKIMPKDVFDAPTKQDIPLDLLKAMQEPLITRWWTIAVLVTIPGPGNKK